MQRKLHWLGATKESRLFIFCLMASNVAQVLLKNKFLQYLQWIAYTVLYQQFETIRLIDVLCIIQILSAVLSYINHLC